MSALLVPVVGRIIDRGYALHVFTGSAILAALLLASLSGVTMLWQFYVLWLILGVTMAGMLYEACFAVLTWSMGKQSCALSRCGVWRNEHHAPCCDRGIARGKKLWLDCWLFGYAMLYLAVTAAALLLGVGFLFRLIICRTRRGINAPASNSAP